MTQKKIVQTIFSSLKIFTITSFFLLLIFIFLSTPQFVFHSLDQLKSKQKITLQNQEIYSPQIQIQKLPPLNLFQFPGQRESEQKLFTIKLNNLQYTINTQLSLAYLPSNSHISQELNDNLYFIQDRIQLTISSKSYFDLNTAQKRETQLKKELINDINSFLKSGKITDIFFSQFLITKIPINSS